MPRRANSRGAERKQRWSSSHAERGAQERGPDKRGNWIVRQNVLRWSKGVGPRQRRSNDVEDVNLRLRFDMRGEEDDAKGAYTVKIETDMHMDMRKRKEASNTTMYQWQGDQPAFQRRVNNRKSRARRRTKRQNTEK